MNKIKLSAIGFLLSLPFAWGVGFGLHFLVSHVQEFAGSDVGFYIGVAVGILISVTGLLKPYVYINVYKGLSAIADIGG
ncbi:hypothetical protein [Catenovulum agarivorans]|uniref:hypothetical protein n=1 Tax=Catenovulum agarivorans TaxID=1172192 RepID=UPI0003607C37|nr:hypothetical protein [Catenovulum agarivorans]